MTAIAQAVTAALLHFVWQGTLVAFVLWIALFALRRRSAQARYAASCAALALLAALPVATGFLAYSAPATASTASAPAAAVSPGAGYVALRTGPLPMAWLAAMQGWALPVWSLGVLLFSVRAVWGCRQVSLMRRRGAPADAGVLGVVADLAARLGIVRPVRVLMTALANGPSVVGWFRPVILVPSATLLGLSPQQLEAVLAHELAHIRRHDHLVNAAQILIETLLFYHPAVWWASARIRAERELCCDDLAVRSCGDALCYARALTTLERLRVMTPAAALGSTGGPMLYRVQRLIGGRQEYGPSKLPGILALSLGLACFALNVHWARGQAQEARGPDTVQFVMYDTRQSDAPGVTVDLGGANLLHRAPVEYPEAALKSGIQGTVAVQVALDSSGNVNDARVLTGPMELRKAVVTSVFQWHFAQDAAGGTRVVNITFAVPPPGSEPHGRTYEFKTGYATNGVLTVERAPGDVDRQKREIQELERAIEEARARNDPAEGLQQSLAELRSQVVSAVSARTERLQEESRVEGLQRKLEEAQKAFQGQNDREARRQLEATRNFLQDQLTAQEQQLREESGRFEVPRGDAQILEDVPASSLAGRTLAKIEIVGLPDAARADLLSRLPVHEGDAMAENTVDALSAAVHKFDEHLSVDVRLAKGNRATVRIAAPRE